MQRAQKLSKELETKVKLKVDKILSEKSKHRHTYDKAQQMSGKTNSLRGTFKIRSWGKVYRRTASQAWIPP